MTYIYFRLFNDVLMTFKLRELTQCNYCTLVHESETMLIKMFIGSCGLSDPWLELLTFAASLTLGSRSFY